MKKLERAAEFIKNIELGTIFTIVCLTLAFSLIIILSFGARFFFRPGVDDSFWGDLAFLLAIIIYSLYFGIAEAKKYFEKKKDGRYQESVNDFKEIRKTVKTKDFEFDQWLEKYYLDEKREYYMSLVNAKTSYTNKYILDLDLEEVKGLLDKTYKKSWVGTEFEGRKDTYFRKITKEQYEVIKDIYKGRYAIKKIPNSYFKTYDSKVANSEYKAHSDENRNNNLYTIGLILYRIFFLFLTQFIFAIFGIKLATGGGGEQVLQNIYDTLTRIINLVSGFTYGWMVGRILTIRKARILEYKTRINNMFNDDKEFKAKTEEEVAKEEYEEEHILKIEMKEATI